MAPCRRIDLERDARRLQRGLGLAGCGAQRDSGGARSERGCSRRDRARAPAAVRTRRTRAGRPSRAASAGGPPPRACPRAARRASAGPSAATLRSTAFASPVARWPTTERTSSTVSDTAARSGTEPANRSWNAPSRMRVQQRALETVDRALRRCGERRVERAQVLHGAEREERRERALPRVEAGTRRLAVERAVGVGARRPANAGRPRRRRRGRRRLWPCSHGKLAAESPRPGRARHATLAGRLQLDELERAVGAAEQEAAPSRVSAPGESVVTSAAGRVRQTESVLPSMASRAPLVAASARTRACCSRP